MKKAYKQLAHKFHGTKPGVKSREKRLQKIQREIKVTKSSTINESSGSLGVDSILKSTGKSHVVLSVGNRA